MNIIQVEAKNNSIVVNPKLKLNLSWRYQVCVYFGVISIYSTHLADAFFLLKATYNWVEQMKVEGVAQR